MKRDRASNPSPTWGACSRAARASSAAHALLALATVVMALASGAPAHAATNIALNRPALASSVEGTVHVAGNAFDGSTGTRWSAAYNGDAQWLQVDLGSVRDIDGVRLLWETAHASAYRIEVSDTGSSWTTVFSTLTGDGGIDDLASARGRGRYVRMSATARGTAFSYSLWEMEVYAPATNLALNRPALASSTQGASYAAANAFDGNTGTRWSAAYTGDSQWLQVDLGSVRDIDGVRLQWETAYAQAYRIEVSDTGSAWTSIYATTTGDGGIDELTTARGRGRYVRMSATARGTAYSYSLWEMAVLGSAAGTPGGTWLSGASGTGVASGDYGTWRGTPVAIAATWADSEAASVVLWQLEPGAEYGAWPRPIDIAVGAFDAGGSWAYAASGTYDARWRQSLTNLKARWGTRSGTVYLRFAHEMNGDWYPWSVNSGNYTQFISAWKRYRALQKEIFPAAKLVFSVNRNSVNMGMDWRSTFPGSAYVDVLSVDYYNQSPYAGTTAEFDSSLLLTDGYGAPIGLKRHQEFAASVGLPFAVSEWSGNADLGDSPAYIQGMFDFFRTNGGTGAGNLLYEIQFNVDRDNARWMLYPTTRMPLSAAKYQQLF